MTSQKAGTDCACGLQVRQEQFVLLGSMPRLEHLDVRNVCGVPPNTPKHMLEKLQPVPGCVLKSLKMNLPHFVQMNLWEAFATSLVNIALRVDVHNHLNMHVTLGNLAAKTPNLHTIHLFRKNSEEHNEDDCRRQTDAIRSALPPTLSCRVSCSLCMAARQ